MAPLIGRGSHAKDKLLAEGQNASSCRSGGNCGKSKTTRERQEGANYLLVEV